MNCPQLYCTVCQIEWRQCLLFQWEWSYCDVTTSKAQVLIHVVIAERSQAVRRIKCLSNIIVQPVVCAGE